MDDQVQQAGSRSKERVNLNKEYLDPRKKNSSFKVDDTSNSYERGRDWKKTNFLGGKSTKEDRSVLKMTPEDLKARLLG